MSIDRFFFRRYDPKHYFCLHHAAEVWAALTGEDIAARLEGVLNGITRDHVNGFTRLAQPVSPCLALMRHAGVMHVGVHIDNRILHITRRGVEFQPVALMQDLFQDLRWYR